MSYPYVLYHYKNKRPQTLWSYYWQRIKKIHPAENYKTNSNPSLYYAQGSSRNTEQMLISFEPDEPLT